MGQLTFGYSDSEDRVWLAFSTDDVQWWLTRRLALRLIGQLASVLEQSLPESGTPADGSASERIAIEHEAAMAPDAAPDEDETASGRTGAGGAPGTDEASAEAEADAKPRAKRPALLANVRIQATSTGTTFVISGAGISRRLRLTRTQAHRFLSALLGQARGRRWLDAPRLPPWLNVRGPGARKGSGPGGPGAGEAAAPAPARRLESDRSAQGGAPQMVSVSISPSIFKAYDIRGIVDQTLTAEAVMHIGRAVGLAGKARGVTAIVVGRDGRLSGPMFVEALAGGINDAGLDVIDIGQVATPMVYFAGFHLDTGSGVMVTGSHNPPDYNGLKMVLAGETLYGPTIQALRESIERGATGALPAATRGTTRTVDVDAAYLQRIVGDIRLARPMKIAIDCGNGSPGRIAPKLYRALGCEVTALFCDVDGTFPNHHPDPAHVENLQDLIRTLAQTDCEIGLAFDGDGDRLGVVTKQGHIIWPDRQLMLFARDVLRQRAGEQVIFDVKCSRHVGNVVRAAGGEPLMWRTGHSLIKAKLKETGAPLAGEMSGHIFFNDRWYGFDDGLYAGARLLEILSRSDDPSAVLDALPDSPTTPELHLRLDEGENFALVEALQKTAKFEGATEVITIDGVRAEYPDGFGLARASNTTPVLVMRFEADTAEALARIQSAFRDAVLAIKPDAKMPF